MKKRTDQCAFSSGGDMGNRTPDLLNAIQTLYQLSYAPKISRGCALNAVIISRYPNFARVCTQNVSLFSFWIRRYPKNHPLCAKFCTNIIIFIEFVDYFCKRCYILCYNICSEAKYERFCKEIYRNVRGL